MSSAEGGLRPSDPVTRGIAPGPQWGSALKPHHIISPWLKVWTLQLGQYPTVGWNKFNATADFQFIIRLRL